MSETAQPAFTGGAIIEALQWRYATKQFDPRREVSSQDLETILEAIHLAPTSSGMQPFHVAVVSDPGEKERIREAAFNQQQTVTASKLLVFSAKPDFREHAHRLFQAAEARGIPPEHVARMRRNHKVSSILRALTGQRTSWAARQAYIALGVALVTAAELGVDACPMEGFRPGKVAKILGLPPGLKPKAMMALGYRSAQDRVLAKYRLPRAELIDQRPVLAG